MSVPSMILPYGDQGDGTYCNPVLFADYSDPDVIAVGEDFYLTASSFNCTPGLPILHSRDLVNWQLIGHAMDRFPDPAYDQPQHGKGVWAPSLRYHDGRFWIFFGAPDEGVFMTTAERPGGPWSPLHRVREGVGLIDPCPFWDEDGSAWLVRAQAGSRLGGANSLLTLHRMAPDGSRLLDDGKVVVDGHFHHPIVEGPKLYKRNGYYYIFAPAGGVKGGWQAVFRSRSIDGPYEDRIVLVQGNTPINGPHQGGWVETAHGEDWFLHFQDRGAAGRVLHLQPMGWGSDDWPWMGESVSANDVHEPVLRHRKPRTSEPQPITRPPTSDDFAGDRLGPQWQWMANSRPAWHGMDKPGLRLFSQGTPGGRAHWFDAGNLLLQKPRDPRFEVTASLRFAGGQVGDQAGLLLLGGVSGALFLEKTAKGCYLAQARLDAPNAPEASVVATLPWESDAVILRMRMWDGECDFAYSVDGDAFTGLGGRIRPREAAWMGAKVGLFALNPGTGPSGGFALYSRFHYESLL